MSHVAANNEIIRMRATVRKARVGVVWKLTKQTKLLKKRTHGDEKTLQKCKRKSEKFIREIKAIAKLKDDDITKFAILNTRNLQEVLTDPKVDRKTRVMTKLAFHKSLKAAIDKFREKFPHYKLGKRQLTNTKLTKPLGIIVPSKLEKGNPENEDEGVKSHNEKDDYNENEDLDGGNSSGDETSEEEASEVSSDSDEENSDKSLKLESKKPKLKLKIEEEIGELPSSPQILKPKKLKQNKNLEEKVSSSSGSNNEEENSGEDSHQPCKTGPISASKKQKLDSKKLKNSKSSQEEISSLPNQHSEEQNIDEETSKLTSKSQKRSKKSEKLNSKNPENLSNFPPISEPQKSSQKSRKIRVVSNLASVKRLKIGESLEETEEITENLNLPTDERKIELNTAEDSFFISAAPGGVYKSIIVPRSNTEGPEDESADNGFRKPFPSTQRGAFNSSNHRQETGGFRKDQRARPNDFGSNRRERRGTEFRKDHKFENNSGRDMIETKKNGEENLHPSWIARKKQQEILKQGFQGKKIVFSDN